MIITKETDYALRILRALTDGEKHTIGEISQSEFIPKQFAYKILKKLAAAKLVAVFRGVEGGCTLAHDLNEISLYDLMVAMGEKGVLSTCVDDSYQCVWREKHGACAVHCRLVEIQQNLENQLKASSLKDILTGCF